MRLNASFGMMFLAAFSVTIIGCQSGLDFEALRAEILDLHRATIDAHLNKDVGFFIKDISEDYISVSRGEILRPSKKEIESQFSSYLGTTTFTEYKDLREPIIGFSRDGTVALSIVQVRVAGRSMLDDGSERDFDDTWAWITLYERQGDKWIRLGEMSNRK